MPNFQGLLSSTRKASTVFNKHTFDVTLMRPGFDVLATTNSTDQFYVLSCTTPGKQIATDEKTTYGPAYNIPYARLFTGDFEFTFLYSQSSHRYISDWMEDIIPSTGKAEYPAYYDDIVGSIIINFYSSDRSSVTTYKLNDCFPKTINGLDLDAGSQNAFQNISASFAFRDFTVDILQNT